jgi:hypothetical protein
MKTYSDVPTTEKELASEEYLKTLIVDYMQM